MTTHALFPTLGSVLDPALEEAVYFGRYCSECGELVAEAEWLEERLYECGECGEQFTSGWSNRCESCNRFATKVSDGPICGLCGTGELGEKDEYVDCPTCGEVLEVEEAMAHVATHATEGAA